MSKYNWTEWPEKKRKGYDKMETKREVVKHFTEIFEDTGSIDDAEARTGIMFRDYTKWRREVEEYDRKRNVVKCPECEQYCQIDLQEAIDAKKNQRQE